jgi:hypothetical protein
LKKILKLKPAFYNKPKPKKMSSKQEVKLNEAVLKEIVCIAREQLVNTVTNEYSMKMFIKGLFLFFLLKNFFKLLLFVFSFIFSGNVMQILTLCQR